MQTDTAHQKKPSLPFILLLSLISSLAALSTDVMLPTLPGIAHDFAVSNVETQKVIVWFFLGVFLGELTFGPVSDRFGRKPTIIASSISFLCGCILSLKAQSFEILLVGRILQGFGSAGPKIVIRALLRDLYSGGVLASVFSLIYTLFIFIPMLAPLLGQGISHYGGWQSIFIFLTGFCLVSTVLFAIFQKETLAKEKRIPLKPRVLLKTSIRIFAHRKVLCLTLISGIVFGMKLTYLSNAQQFFAQYYGIEEEFPLYFAFLASAIGSAFFLNSKLVEKLGGLKLCIFAVILLCVMSSLLFLTSLLNHGTPIFSLFLFCLFGMFFSFGLLWGNLAALAMEYLGSVAGIGATVMSAGSSLFAFFLATFLGKLYSETLLPIALGYMCVSFIGAFLLFSVIKSQHHHAIEPVKSE